MLMFAVALLAAAPATAQYPATDAGRPPAVDYGVVAPRVETYGTTPATPQLPSGAASFSSAARSEPLYPYAAGPTSPTDLGDPTPYAGGQIVARIAGEVVLAADVMEGVAETLEANKDRAPPEELEKLRLMLMKRNLDKLVDTKLLYAEARRTIPAENFPTIEEQVEKQFEKDRLVKLYEATKTRDRAELEAKLEQFGSSLVKQQRSYCERVVAQQWLRQNVKFEEEITHDEMLAYYQEHLADFEFEAKARWEELAVRFDRFPSKADAYRALAAMGNQIWQGAALAEVARASSHGVTADEGGQYDWTTRGSLISQDLNRALFTLPVGQLSPIIETPLGFHIIRVLERHDAGSTPFVEAQPKIKEKIKDGQREAKVEAYMANLREQSPVWTIFDNHPELSQRSEP